MNSTAVVWDQALIQKYNQSGPRYTSYPTALEFTTDFPEAAFLAATQEAPNRPLSLYLHIPFCHKLCYYCACNKIVTRHQEKADEYLDYLEREIAQRAPLFASRLVTQLHWGGGTPTFLTPAQLRRLMAALRQHFNFAFDAELSIEIDPRSIDLARLDELRAEGFNRISVGVQDFDKRVQEAVNRVQDNDFIHALLQRAQELGFRSTNIDLIYGLPYQTPESFHTTLLEIIKAQPARLSVFNYAHLPSRFAAQSKLNEAAMPSPSMKLALLQETITTLTEAGYQFIGMDHFAKPDDELAKAQRDGVLHRNFQGYTTQGECDLLGLGVSAISMLGSIYAQNQKDLPAYYQAVTAQGHALWKGYQLERDDLIRRDLIKELICNFRLEIAPLERRYQIDFADYFAEDLALLAPLCADGLVIKTVEKIEVTPAGELLIRNICMCFDRHLRVKARQQQFSRVI